MKTKRIIIPTYPPHFKWNELFLRSVKKYCTDYENVKISFIIEKENDTLFNSFIADYKSDNIGVKFIEDLTQEYSKLKPPSDIWDKYTYQSIKKMMAVIKSDSELNLVLDSENICVKKFKFCDLFRNHDKIYYCDWIISNVQKRVLKESNEIMNAPENTKWFFETSFWIYRKSIFKKILKHILDVNGLSKSELLKYLQTKVFFEKNLYDIYLLKNSLNSDLVDQRDSQFIFNNPLLYKKQITTEHIISHIESNEIDKYINFVNKRQYIIFRTNDLINNNLIDRIIKNTDLVVATLFDFREDFYNFWNERINSTGIKHEA